MEYHASSINIFGVSLAVILRSIIIRFYNQEMSFSQRIPLIKDIKHFFKNHRLNVNKLITKS